MTNKINEGGRAFARNGSYSEQDGMTMRDYFAGQILSGQMSIAMLKPIDVAWMEAHGAEYVYQVADAMLAARKGQRHD